MGQHLERRVYPNHQGGEEQGADDDFDIHRRPRGNRFARVAARNIGASAGYNQGNSEFLNGEREKRLPDGQHGDF